MNKQDGGLTIGSQKFNVVCYAEDLLLCSTTVTGLQNLINIANEFIVQNGLRFNPNKSTCITYGKIPFICQPKWFIGDDQLRNEEYLKYVGAIIGNNNSYLHITSRHFILYRVLGFAIKVLQPKQLHMYGHLLVKVFYYMDVKLCF